MRGALDGYDQFGDRAGIIPADAGSTDLQVLYFSLYEDHPRGCGEHRLFSERRRLL